MIKKKWKDLEIGEVLPDGSTVTGIHPIQELPSYELEYKSGNFKKKKIILSSDHLLLCDISRVQEKLKDELVIISKNIKIPSTVDYTIETKGDLTSKEQEAMELYFRTGDIQEQHYKTLEKCSVLEEVLEYESPIVDENNLWLSVRNISHLIKYNQDVRSNGKKLTKTRFLGELKVRCIATDTGKYEVNDLIHHNSVAVRNIIFHAMTHSNKMSIGLVDLKQTEFTYFKGKEGIVGVANSVQETAELLRIARDVMYKRNKEMASLGLTDLVDFKPKKKTDRIWVTGVEMGENETLTVQVDGEEKSMTSGELLDYLEQ